MSQLTDQMPFQPWTSKYKPINAYWMARFSKIAYAKKTDGSPDVNAIRSELGAIDPKFTDVSGFDAQSSQGVVIKNEEYVVATFRGTDEIADWLDNLNAVAKDGPLGNVHTGFHRALMDTSMRFQTSVTSFRIRASWVSPRTGAKPVPTSCSMGN